MPRKHKKKAHPPPPPAVAVDVPDSRESDGIISPFYPDLLTTKLDNQYVSDHVWSKLETFISVVYYDQSWRSQHTILHDRDADEEEEDVEHGIDDEKLELVRTRDANAQKHQWYMPKFLSHPTNQRASTFQPDLRNDEEKSFIKRTLLSEVLGAEFLNYKCTLYPSKHRQRLNFYFGVMFMHLLISGVLLGLFANCHTPSNVSFTFGELQSMWANSPNGREWNAVLVSLIVLPILVVPATIGFAYLSYSFQPSSTTTVKAEHEHEQSFWGFIAIIQGWWAVMAAAAMGQTELIGMMAIGLLVATSFIIYSVMNCYIDRLFQCAHHLVALAPSILMIVAIASISNISALDLTVAIIWLISFIFFHALFSVIVYSEERMHYTNAQRYGDIFIEHFLFRVDHWLRSRAPHDIVACGIMFDTDKAHIMTGETWENWIGSSFLKYFNPPDKNATTSTGIHAGAAYQLELSVRTIPPDKFNDGDVANIRDAEFDELFPWRRTLRLFIGAMFVGHLVGLICICILPLTSASAWARIGMQHDHELVSTGKWPMAYATWATVCVAVMIGCWRMYSNFEWYMKETFFYHGISSSRFAFLFFVDGAMMLLVAQAIGATDCFEVVGLCGCLLLADLFLCVYQESSVHDWYFWAFLCRFLPWLAIFIRALAIDGDLDPDRTGKKFVAFVAVIGHWAEIIGHVLIVSSPPSSRGAIDWWGVIELSWIILRTTLHVFVFATVLSTNILLSN